MQDWIGEKRVLDPIGGKTVPLDGAVQKILLSEAAGSASRDLRAGLRYASSAAFSCSIVTSIFQHLKIFNCKALKWMRNVSFG